MPDMEMYLLCQNIGESDYMWNMIQLWHKPYDPKPFYFTYLCLDMQKEGSLALDSGSKFPDKYKKTLDLHWIGGS